MSHVNRQAFINLFRDTMAFGNIIKPRGEEVRELIDAQIRLDPRFPFQAFKSRKYSLDYFKKEMRWKLGASRFDDSIKMHAKMWEAVQNPDGSFNSNYGQYWFGDQMGLMKAVLELVRDKDSRRASIPMLTNAHLTPETKDTVCTEAVTLQIRHGSLHMSVHMRSSDQIFGLGTDVPTFSVLLMLAYGFLSEVYPELSVGIITITAASSHIYARHFKMVESILNEEISEYQDILLPQSSGAEESMIVIADRGRVRTEMDQLSKDMFRLWRFIHE